MNPWMKFEQARCFLENQCNCEFIYDALIRQPSAFWSSLSFMFSGLWLYRQVRVKSFELKLWVGSVLMLGLASHLAHGTFTRVALALDMASIVMVMSLHLLLKLMRGWGPFKVLGGLAAYFVLICSMMYVLPKWWLIGVCVGIFFVALLDLLSELKDRRLQMALSILIGSFVMFMLDELKVFCEPQSLFQLHSLWHFGAAYALYLFGSWRFQERPATAPSDYRSGTEA